MIRFFSILLLLGSSWGCSHSPFQEEIRPKTFQITRVWTRSTLSKENELFRRIHRMSPVLYEDIVIQGNATDSLVAYHQITGQELWRYPRPLGVEASVVAFKDRLYIAFSDGQVEALTLKTGKPIWSVSTKTENLAQPLLDSDSGSLFVLSGNGVVYSLAADSGKIQWVYTRQDPSSFSIRGGPQPLLKDGLLYIGFSEGSFVALNPKSGTVAWEMALNKNKRFKDVDSTAVFDKDRIYVSGFDDKLYALSLKGDILWKVDEGGYSAVKLDGDNLYYSTTSGKVMSLNKHTGTIQWSYHLKEGIATQAQVYKGLIVFGESQGSLVFLNQKGEKISSFEPGRGLLASPTVDENKSRIYFISGDANLYVLEAKWALPADFPYLK